MVVNAEDQNAGKGNRCRKLYSEHKVIVLSICLIVIGVIVGILLILAIPVLLKKVDRPYRLPTDLLPYHYELEVKPHLTPNDFIFEGKVAIHVICSKKTDSIILHARNLTIKEKSIKVTSIDSGEDYEVLLVDYDTTNDLLILRLLEELKEWTRYRIYIDYTGILTEQGTGFYVSSYEDDQNVTHYVASTDFEPVDARRAFPCFDEPQLKSKFNITLVRWDNMTTLSNMPKLRTENRGRYWKADVYEESMKMSTYLVAFVFCDYVGNTKGKVTVWSPKHRRNNTDRALEVAIKTLEFLEEKLKIPYPGAKLDMVPVPYLQASAMENWGLIIYSENTLLTPEEKGEEDVMANTLITSVVSHEIAHQWFGNLVTLKWWSDAWLNEGITSYMEHLITAAILPDWNQVDPTVKEAFNEFPYYCFKNKPLRRAVHNSEEASDMFHSVTYDKGAMITRMAHYILGEEVFWKGIQRYLITFSHENAEESDFWKHLTAAQLHKPRLDMEEIMRPWTHLGSAPIVTAHRNYSTRKAIISQQPCNQDNKENENDIWNIPLVFGTKFHSNISGKIMWLTTKNTTVEDMPEEKHWIVINANATGYYLVNYDRKNWELLCKQLLQSHTIFQPTERYKLIVDITMLDGMGYVDIDLVFQCLLYTPQENEVVIQQHQILYLHSYLNYFDEEKDFELMEEFTVHMSKRIYDKYGWDGRRNSTKMLSEDEISLGLLTTSVLCHLGYGPCVEEGFNRYEEIRNPEKKLSFSYYTWIILCAVSGNASLEEWDSIKDQYSDKIFENLSLALCSKDASIIRQELRNSYDRDEEQGFFGLLFETAFTKIAFDECLNFVDVNFHKIPATKIELYQHVKERLKRFGNLSRMKRIVSLLERHRRNASGLKAKNIGKVLEFFEETMPSWQKRARQLRSWLQKKLWRNG